MRLKKISLWLVPLIIFIGLSTVVYLQQMHEIKILPDEGWSRSYALPFITNDTVPFVSEKDGLYHIYGPTKDDTLNHLVINDKLEVIKQEILPIAAPNGERLWADEQTVVYFKKGKLKLVKNGHNAILAENVGDMSANENTILYSIGNQLFSFDIGRMKSQLVKTFDQTIKGIESTKESNDFMIVSSNGSGTQYLSLLKNNTDGLTAYPIYKFHTSTNESISNINFVETGDKVFVNYTKATFIAGVSTSHYYFTIPINKISQVQTENIVPHKIYFYESGSQLPFLDMKNLALSLVDGKPTFLISAEGKLGTNGITTNIYFAQQQENKDHWIGGRRSTSPAAAHPFRLNDHTIAWLSFYDEHTYQLTASSTDPQLIEASLNVTDEDRGIATSRTLILLSGAVLLLVVMMIASVPSFVLFFISMIVNIKAIEVRSTKIKIASIIVFGLAQLYVFYSLVAPVIALRAPNYLLFTGSLWIFSIISLIIAWLFTEWMKNENWGMFTEFGYFAFLNSLIISFIFGEYIFNISAIV